MRTMQSRLLLRPSVALREIVLGVLGRAQALYGLRLHAFVFLSNHFHLLCSPTDPAQLASFMCFLNGNLAKEAGRLHAWREKFWARPYKLIEVSNEPAAQLARLRYLLSQGCKEGFVATPADWPGAHCVDALLEGRALTGLWFDRSQEYEARRRGLEFGPQTFATQETVVLAPLPCLSHLDESSRQSFLAELVDEIERETAAENRRLHRAPLGAAFVRRQDPHEKPLATKRSPAPQVHAASRAVRLAMLQAYRTFLAAYRQASQRLRSGDRYVTFPEHCFPPHLPFVRGPATALGA